MKMGWIAVIIIHDYPDSWKFAFWTDPLLDIEISPTDVLIAYIDGVPVGCAGSRRHSNSEAELKRVWVEPEYRSQHIATNLIGQIEEKARKQGFKRIVLQTREKMSNAVELYRKRGYKQIENYPPYDKLDGAVCYSKEL